MRAFPWIFLFTAVATLGLALALARSDFSIRYVAEHTATNLPPLYKVAALFAGKSGLSLSFALLLCAGAAASAVPSSRGARRWGLCALALITLAALAWAALGAPPFARVPWLLIDGRGLQPALQNPLLFTQRPLILLGSALLVLAAALALDPDRRATLSGWLFAAWLSELVACMLGGADWFSGSGLGVATVALCMPVIRRQWWPRTRRGVYALSAAATLAVFFRLLEIAGPSAAIDISLGQGESTKVTDAFDHEWTLTQQGISAFRAENREITAVTIEATPDGADGTLLVSERRQTVDSRGEEIGSAIVVPGRRHGLAQELLVRLERLLPDNGARLRVEFRGFEAGPSAAYVLLLLTGALLWIGARRDA